MENTPNENGERTDSSSTKTDDSNHSPFYDGRALQGIRSALLEIFPKENREVIIDIKGTRFFLDLLFEESKTAVMFFDRGMKEEGYYRTVSSLKKQGYKIVWIFDVDEEIEKKEIESGLLKFAYHRHWAEAPKVFKKYRPQFYLGVEEAWFAFHARAQGKEIRFFQALESEDGLSSMECDACISIKEFARYLAKGKKTPNYQALYDIKYGVQRTNGDYSLFFCPKDGENAFFEWGKCDHCPFGGSLPDKNTIPHQRVCTFRFEKMDWEGCEEITKTNRRFDGLIDLIEYSSDTGMNRSVKLDCPNTFLRTLPQLWENYKKTHPRYLVAYNTCRKQTYWVPKPKLISGFLKWSEGWRCDPNILRILSGSRTTIPDIDQPVWLVVAINRFSDEEPSFVARPRIHSRF